MVRIAALVRSRVVPPAPKVTETNDGASGASRSTERQSLSAPSGVCGGKNSKDRPGRALVVSVMMHRSVPTMKFAAMRIPLDSLPGNA